MPGPLARLYVQLGLDAREFDSGLGKAQKSMTGFGRGADMALRGAAGAIGGGMAFAARGALEMENQMAAFRAETGASVEEAERFGNELNAMAGSSLVSMDDIAGAMTAIRTDLGLTGDEASAAAVAFEDYMRATSQGSDAVLAFDDILDAWNLEADKSAEIMDVLVKSHQLYGGSIAENQKLLADLAPALQAANMDWEEGQALLNLFARAGVSGEAATTAFNRALKMVESPQELQRLLSDISSMEDPFERAQRAAEVFGSRAGTKLGQALGDADGDITQFGISAVEAFGATEDAAAALDGTLTSQIQLAINHATSLFRGFGMELGPILTGAAAAANLAGALLPPGALSAAWTKIGGSRAVTAAVGAAGAAAGLVYQGAAFVATKLMAAATAIWTAIGGPTSGTVTAAFASGSAAGAAYQLGVAAGVAGGALSIGTAALGTAQITKEIVDVGTGAKTELEGLDAVLNDVLGGIFGQTADLIMPGFRKDLEEIKSFAADGTADIGKAMSDEMKALDPGTFAVPVKGMEASLVKGMPGLMQVVANKIEALVQTIPDGVDASFDAAAESITQGFGNIKSALANPPQLISREDRVGNMEKRQRIINRRLRKAVEIDDPWNISYYTNAAIAQDRRLDRLRGNHGMSTADIRRKYERMGVNIEGTWLDTERVAGRAARGAKQTAVQQAQQTATQVQGIFGSVDLFGAGSSMVQTWIDGVASMTDMVKLTAGNLASAFAEFFKAGSPPKRGPLSTIDSDGQRLVASWLGGIEGSGGKVRRAADLLAGAFAPSPTSPAPALAVAGGMGGGGGTVVNVTVNGMYGGDSGLRELEGRIEKAVRVTRRTRDR